ncbi:MAG TPA: amidase family protein [Longimicrobiales bacterium]|nr:amidase family protein [Longimicrobiales bacterium]
MTSVPALRAFVRAAVLTACLVFPTPAPASSQVEVTEASVTQLQEWMASGRTTSVEITAAYLSRIQAYDQAGPRLNAMIRLNPNALAEAEALDRERALKGPRGPLHGIPVILKDNYDLAGMPTTAGSLGLAGMMPPDDATQVRKLREAGAVFIGKANMHELASGITTIASLGGQTLNPYDLTRNPGGSSGGTGAAIAASFAALGWGTDTCGSIRIPASHNNLVGLRPTKGLSSIDGIIPLAHSQDVGGPLARSVADLAVGLDATVGPDPADPATEAWEGRAPISFAGALDAGALKGTRIGILRGLFGGSGENDGAPLVRAALAKMVELGADTATVVIPDLDSLIARSGRIAHEMRPDILAYLAGVPGAPANSLGLLLAEGTVHEALIARLRTRNATPLDSAAYARAVEAGERLRAATTAALDSARLDALVYPTMNVAPSINPDAQRGSTCGLSAQSGLPAITVPAGFTPTGLPMGMEILGRAFDDTRLVGLAYAYERAAGNRRAPPTTPPLVDGHAPPPRSWTATAAGAGPDRAEARLTFDPTRGTLDWDVAVSGVPADELHAVALRRKDAEGRRSVVLRLAGPGVLRATGTELLTPNLRAWLEAGALTLEVFTRAHPFGSARAVLEVPR